jgi:hypothetical protein
MPLVKTDDGKTAVPEYLARKGKGPMDEEELSAILSRVVNESVTFIDGELSVERAQSTDYYHGRPFGNEEEGRSQVVLTEVRDAVDGMLPSLLRIFFGPEHTVEFVPNTADDVEGAAQKTDYVRYVHEEDNPGFLTTMSVLKDGLIRRLGILKWGWDDSENVKAYKQEGLTREQLELLAEDDEVDLTKAVARKPTESMLADFKKVQMQYERMQQMAQAAAPAGAGPAPQAGAPAAPPPPPLPPAPVLPVYYDVEFTRTIEGGKLSVWAIPPEEFIHNAEARSIDTALLVGHRMQKTKGQLIALGIKEELIDEHGGPDTDLDNTADIQARRDIAQVGRSGGTGSIMDPQAGEANTKIAYGEFYMTIDEDGDGIAELRRIITIGPTFYPVQSDPAIERQFAIFTPYPEPHTLQGGSVADRTKDIQRITSAILRAILDSGAASIFPRTVYKEGAASVADIMNTAIGAPMRERETGAIRIMETPFTGDKMMPVLGFMQEVIERRTGQSKGAAGLDDDALQSTGKEAVGAHLVASQAQIEMIARVFAEQCYKPLFKGLGRLLKERQQRARMVCLRGHYVEVDPREWYDSMEVTCNVGLGSTFIEKKVGTLMAVAMDQQQVLEKLGFDNPLVSLPMLRNTRAKILQLQGIKDVDSYYKPLPMDWQPPAPAAPQPTPEQQWMETEKAMAREKNIKELAIKQDELKLKQDAQEFDQALQVRKLAADTAVRRYAIEAQFHQSMTEADMESRINSEAREVELTLVAHDQLHDQAMERASQDHTVNMDTRAADTADAAQQADAAAAPTGAGE